MKLLKISAFVLTAALVLNACKKKDDNSNTGGSGSKKDILKSHSWVASDILVNDTSLWIIVQDCERDNVFTFKDNDVVTTDEGATKCDPADPQSTDDVWKLLNNDTKIIWMEDTVDILEISSGKLRFGMTDGGDKYEMRLVPKP